jgi:hypothetical protein
MLSAHYPHLHAADQKQGLHYTRFGDNDPGQGKQNQRPSIAEAAKKTVSEGRIREVKVRVVLRIRYRRRSAIWLMDAPRKR